MWLCCCSRSWTNFLSVSSTEIDMLTGVARRVSGEPYCESYWTVLASTLSCGPSVWSIAPDTWICHTVFSLNLTTSHRLSRCRRIALLSSARSTTITSPQYRLLHINHELPTLLQPTPRVLDPWSSNKTMLKNQVADDRISCWQAQCSILSWLGQLVSGPGSSTYSMTQPRPPLRWLRYIVVAFSNKIVRVLLEISKVPLTKSNPLQTLATYAKQPYGCPNLDISDGRLLLHVSRHPYLFRLLPRTQLENSTSMRSLNLPVVRLPRKRRERHSCKGRAARFVVEQAEIFTRTTASVDIQKDRFWGEALWCWWNWLAVGRQTRRRGKRKAPELIRDPWLVQIKHFSLFHAVYPDRCALSYVHLCTQYMAYSRTCFALNWRRVRGGGVGISFAPKNSWSDIWLSRQILALLKPCLLRVLYTILVLVWCMRILAKWGIHSRHENTIMANENQHSCSINIAVVVAIVIMSIVRTVWVNIMSRMLGGYVAKLQYLTTQRKLMIEKHFKDSQWSQPKWKSFGQLPALPWLDLWLHSDVFASRAGRNWEIAKPIKKAQIEMGAFINLPQSAFTVF